MKYKIQVLILENVIMYIPVAEDTLGGTPRPINNGLNITPPPNPSAPATQPALKPRARIFLITIPSKTKSDSTILMSPNSLLIFCSLATNLDPMITKQIIMKIKMPYRMLSPAEHFSKPGDPLRKETIKRTNSKKKLMPCFFQIP